MYIFWKTGNKAIAIGKTTKQNLMMPICPKRLINFEKNGVITTVANPVIEAANPITDVEVPQV